MEGRSYVTVSYTTTQKKNKKRMKVIAPDLVFPSQPCLPSPLYSQFRIVISKRNENKIRLIKGSWMVEDKVSTELRKPFPYSLLFAASFGKS
jgi:hypothetical protein